MSLSCGLKVIYKVPPKSKLGKALNYFTNEYEYLQLAATTGCSVILKLALVQVRFFTAYFALQT
jgi:hypothetical protein